MIYTSGMARAYQEQLLQEGESGRAAEPSVLKTERGLPERIGASLSVIVSSWLSRKCPGDAKTTL